MKESWPDRAGRTLRNLFKGKPEAIAATEKAIRSIILDADLLFLPYSIEADAIMLIQNDATVVEAVESGRWTARGCALVALHTITHDALTCGMHHIYRGILSGGGHDIRKLWNRVAREMVQMEVASDEEVEEARAVLEEGIAEVG